MEDEEGEGVKEVKSAPEEAEGEDTKGDETPDT